MGVGVGVGTLSVHAFMHVRFPASVETLSFDFNGWGLCRAFAAADNLSRRAMTNCFSSTSLLCSKQPSSRSVKNALMVGLIRFQVRKSTPARRAQRASSSGNAVSLRRHVSMSSSR